MPRTRVFRADQNPSIDPPHNHVSESRKIRLIKRGAIELRDGSIQLPSRLEPVPEQLRPKPIPYEVWWILPQLMRAYLNEGADGQGVIHYPVPAAYSSDLTRAQYQFCPAAKL